MLNAWAGSVVTLVGMARAIVDGSVPGLGAAVGQASLAVDPGVGEAGEPANSIDDRNNGFNCSGGPCGDDGV